MPSFLRTPKGQLFVALLAIYLIAFLQFPSVQTFSVLVISIGLAVVFDLVFTYMRKKILFVPLAAVVTGMIVALLVNPGVAWYEIALIQAIAMGTKNFLRVTGRHIFNPAAIGLYAGGVLLHQYVAWWGLSFQSVRSLPPVQFLLFLVLLIPGVISAYRLRKAYSIVVFLLLYAVFSSMFTLSVPALVTRLVNPSVLFFSLVMIPDPMTSPQQPVRQILYGAIIASTAFLLSKEPLQSLFTGTGFLPDIFLPALLLGNVLFFKFR